MSRDPSMPRGEEKTRPVDTPAAFADRFGVSRETMEKLETYSELLRTWQKTINLVAPSTLDHVWHRHFTDSAQIMALAAQAIGPRLDDVAPLRWVDLGSGAGFPGLVVAILLAARPGAAAVTLIESDQRKAAFLREVARRTGTRVDILSIRIEQAATQFNLPRADVVSARALAPLPKLLGLAAPFLSASSVGLFLKGRDVEAEIRDARRSWAFDCALVASVTDEDARIAVIGNLRAQGEVEP